MPPVAFCVAAAGGAARESSSGKKRRLEYPRPTAPAAGASYTSTITQYETTTLLQVSSELDEIEIERAAQHTSVPLHDHTNRLPRYYTTVPWVSSVLYKLEIERAAQHY